MSFYKKLFFTVLISNFLFAQDFINDDLIESLIDDFNREKYNSVLKRINEIEVKDSDNSINVLEIFSMKAYLGLKEYMDTNKIDDVNGIFISTAHSIKFKDVVENTINSQVEYPKSIKDILKKEKRSFSIENYSELKDFLLERN